MTNIRLNIAIIVTLFKFLLYSFYYKKVFLYSSNEINSEKRVNETKTENKFTEAGKHQKKKN